MSSSYKIGFGCASLTRLNDRLALELLSHAYDEGITHYDVARLYGEGNAERILGEFARNKRDSITITTKFGLNSPGVIPKKNKMMGIIKSIVKTIPGLQKPAAKKLHPAFIRDFSLKNANASLEKSLRELNTDYIDYYLLHEAGSVDANNESLLTFLDQKKREGKILEYGIGSWYHQIEGDCNLFNSKYRVFQFDSNVFNENILKLRNRENKLVITHSALQGVKILEQNLAGLDGDLIRSHSRALNINLNNYKMIPGMLLFYSFLLNPDTITLFSSTRKDNISNNLRYLRLFSSLHPDRKALKQFIRDLKNGSGQL